MANNPPRAGVRQFASMFGGVGAVGALTYIGEYASFVVVLAFLSDKLTGPFNLGTFGYLFVGTISGIYLVVSGLIAIPIGHLCDKYGRRRFAILGCAFGVLGLSMVIVSNRLSDIVPFSIAMGVGLSGLGLGHGTYTAATLSYTGDLAEKHKGMGKPFGLIEGAEFAGYAFGPALGTTLAFIFVSRVVVFEFSALLLVIAAGVAFMFMPEIRDVVSLGTGYAPMGVGPSLVAAAPGLGGGVEDHAHDYHDHSHSASWRDYVSAFRTPIIGVALLTTFVGSIGFSGFFYYVPLYANSLIPAIPIFKLLYGYFGSIMAATAVILMVPVGHIEDKGGRRMPYLVAGLIAGAVSLGFVFFFTPSVPSFFIGSVAFGSSIAVVRISQLVILAEKSNPSNRAAIMGTNHAVEHTGYGVASLAVGAMVAFFGFAGAFRFLSLVLFMAGVAFLLYSMATNVR